MKRFTSAKNMLCVSRAATAIYLILKENNIFGKNVLVPANICYAAVYPIISSGNTPAFCDIDDIYGNVSARSVQSQNNISAAIIPHMYGNPVKDIKKIKDHFRKNNILFIEDCACALGASIDGHMCGDHGDYSIFSTGYAKTIDLGAGGIICSDRDLSHIEQMYMQLHEKNDTDEANEQHFSKLYRQIRNNPDQGKSSNIWNELGGNVKDIFINRIPGIDSIIRNGLEDWESVVKTRREKYSLYLSLLEKSKTMDPMPLSDGASPWRFSMLVSSDLHRPLIDHLLERNVPVSDWYPNVTPLFGAKEEFERIDGAEKRIINLPLLIDDQTITEYCRLINSFLHQA